MSSYSQLFGCLATEKSLSFSYRRELERDNNSFQLLEYSFLFNFTIIILNKKYIKSVFTHFISCFQKEELYSEVFVFLIFKIHHSEG